MDKCHPEGAQEHILDQWRLQELLFHREELECHSISVNHFDASILQFLS